MNGVIFSRNERILPYNNISVGKKIKLLSIEMFNNKKKI